MLVESRTHPCNEATHLPELNQSRQQLSAVRHLMVKLTRLRWRRIHQARASAPRCLSDGPTTCDLGTGDLDCGGASPPTLGQSTDCSNHSIPADCSHELDLDENRTQVVTIWCSRDSSVWSQGGVGFRLPCPLPPWRGAGCCRRSSGCRHTILFWQWHRQRLKGRVGFAQDLKTVLHRNHRVRRRKLVGSIEAVSAPKEHVVIDHECLHLARLISNKAHTRLELSNFPSADFLLGAPDAWEDDVAKHCDPVHTLGRQVLDRAIEGIVGVRSQTLEQRHTSFSRLFHIRARSGFWARRQQIWSASNLVRFPPHRRPPACPGWARNQASQQAPPTEKPDMPCAYQTSWPERGRRPSKWAFLQGKSFCTEGT